MKTVVDSSVGFGVWVGANVGPSGAGVMVASKIEVSAALRIK